MALEWDDLLIIGISVFALVPFAIAVMAYRRTPTLRVLLFASAFAAFALKGAVIAAEVFLYPGNALLDGTELVLDATILGLFFLGMIKE